MKQEQQLLLDQLNIAMGRAHTHIHEPIASDASTYQNMMLLRGYLDALWEALRANSRHCEDLGSMRRSLRAGLDLAGRVMLCRNWCIDLATAIARKDEETLRIMRVHKSCPMNILSKEEYGDPEDKEEDKEYFARLEGVFSMVEGYLATLTEKWAEYFEPRYEKPKRPDGIVVEEEN